MKSLGPPARAVLFASALIAAGACKPGSPPHSQAPAKESDPGALTSFERRVLMDLDALAGRRATAEFAKELEKTPGLRKALDSGPAPEDLTRSGAFEGPERA